MWGENDQRLLRASAQATLNGQGRCALAYRPPPRLSTRRKLLYRGLGPCWHRDTAAPALNHDTLVRSQINPDFFKPLLGFLPLVAAYNPNRHPDHSLIEPTQ